MFSNNRIFEQQNYYKSDAGFILYELDILVMFYLRWEKLTDNDNDEFKKNVNGAKNSIKLNFKMLFSNESKNMKVTSTENGTVF